MRNDAVGLFWEETTDKHNKKHRILAEEGWQEVSPGFWAHEKCLKKHDTLECLVAEHEAYILARESRANVKREPPEPVWLEPGYLPGLDEARAFDVPLYTPDLMFKDSKNGNNTLIFDVECYPNYFLIAFKNPETGYIICFERTDETDYDYPLLNWLLENFTIVGFNSRNYDIPMVTAAQAGYDTTALKNLTTEIIEEGIRAWDLYRNHKLKELEGDHIDVMELAPLHASLKLYSGRLHCRKMQDLPFPPERILNEDQIAITRLYCVNDLDNTIELYQALDQDLTLRRKMSKDYGFDLRSRSDAQIAEHVIKKEVERRSGKRVYRPNIEPGTVYRFNVPYWAKFRTPLLQTVLATVSQAAYVVNWKGSIDLPDEIEVMRPVINKTIYKLGIGGLHSMEKSMSHRAGDKYVIIDRDVTSYYPFIILNQGLYPPQLGRTFLDIYRDIVLTRLAAKREGDKATADSLKITINGAYGKMSSKWSYLYSPGLQIQVTLSGQLALLLLIEDLELAGIEVVSANTDGIVIKALTHQEDIVNTIIDSWEQRTSFNTEETRYRALFSRDVNNYIAVKEDGSGVKCKGVFAEPGLFKNPQNVICIEAIRELLLNKTPIEETIRSCKDITKFLTVRTVRGGAVKDGEFLGKAIRWYYAEEGSGEIVYAKSGNKVPRTDNAKPLMELPSEFPEDVLYDWYIDESEKLLTQVSY